MGTSVNPTLQDFLLLFINFGYQLLITTTTIVLGLIPTVVQLVVNLLVGGLQQGGGS